MSAAHIFEAVRSLGLMMPCSTSESTVALRVAVAVYVWRPSSRITYARPRLMPTATHAALALDVKVILAPPVYFIADYPYKIYMVA